MPQTITVKSSEQALIKISPKDVIFSNVLSDMVILSVQSKEIPLIPFEEKHIRKALWPKSVKSQNSKDLLGWLKVAEFLEIEPSLEIGCKAVGKLLQKQNRTLHSFPEIFDKVSLQTTDKIEQYLQLPSCTLAVAEQLLGKLQSHLEQMGPWRKSDIQSVLDYARVQEGEDQPYGQAYLAIFKGEAGTIQALLKNNSLDKNALNQLMDVARAEKKQVDSDRQYELKSIVSSLRTAIAERDLIEKNIHNTLNGQAYLAIFKGEAGTIQALLKNNSLDKNALNQLMDVARAEEREAASYRQDRLKSIVSSLSSSYKSL